MERRIVRQLRHGQVTIPKEFREAMHLEPSDMLAMSLRDGRLEVEPVRVTPKAAGSPWVRELYDLFEPTRESLKDIPEEEINRAIDDAVREVRRRRTTE